MALLYMFRVTISPTIRSTYAVVGTGCRVEMTTQQSNIYAIYFRCSVVQ